MPVTTDVFAISDAMVRDLVAQQPLLGTFSGVPGFDDRWDDFSLAGCERHQELLSHYQSQLVATLCGQEDKDLAAQLMLDYIDEQLDVYRNGDHLLAMNSIESPFQHMRQIFDVMDRSSVAAWENICRRLETIDQAASSYLSLLEAGRTAGQTVAVRQVKACIEQGRINAGPESAFHQLPAALSSSGVETPALLERLSKGIKHACGVYDGLVDYLQQGYLPDAVPEDAVGPSRYARCARRYLGMSLDAEETYHWGWAEIHAIQAEMTRLARLVDDRLTLKQVLDLLHSDEARCAPSPEVFCSMMLERQLKALQDLDGTHFDIPEPIKKITVHLATRGGPIGAYYVPPTEDFQRAGSVWYSLGSQTQIPVFEHISTAYHEGFPGHHLQCGVQVALAGQLSRFHRLFIWYSGYGEGWALYAERLMQELGYFEKPDYEIGMWSCQLMRACRVVLDIGCHLQLPIPDTETFHPGEVWNYDLGVEFMQSRAGMTVERSRSELTRYLGWPGQAICYKVGERAILGLRDELRRRQGAAFSTKAFHQQVVGSGAMGLDRLRKRLLG